MEWIVLVVLGVGLGLPLLGGWLYLMRTRDPDSEEWAERMDHPTLVTGPKTTGMSNGAMSNYVPDPTSPPR